MPIHLYYGNGKGKTTAGLGLALRALGQGQKVVLIQFMKKGDFGEIKALKKFPKVIVKQFGRKGFVKENNIIDKKLARSGLAFAKNILRKKIYPVKSPTQGRGVPPTAGQFDGVDILILDELNTAVSFKLLSEREVLAFLRKIPKSTEVIITGRGENKKIKAQADLVTEMKEVKHYFKQGLKARKGIEF